MTSETWNLSSAPASDVKATYPEFYGPGGALLWIMLRSVVLTLLTLGLYQFWMRARVRRFYWSATSIDGHTFEYSGTGLEKFLGFLMAVVVLAVYLVIFNFVLYLVGLSLLENAQFAPLLSALALLPLIYFAQYRARRYVLSRTKFRGIRFGAEPAALRYMGYALLQLLITVVTLGLLYPRMIYKLDKYRTDRTYFGSLKFEQTGSWFALIKPWAFVVVYTIIMIAALAIGALEENIFFISVSSLLYVGFFVVLLWYSVASFRILTGQKRLGQGVSLTSKADTPSIVGIYILGSLLIGLIITVVLIILGVIGTFALGSVMSDMLADGADGFDPELLMQNQLDMVIYLVIGFYIATVLLYSALAEVLITRPLTGHYISTLSLIGAEEIAAAEQRDHDQMGEAEGFADALDVGAAF